MWHEARKQEKKIRGLMVDFKRRADRRREFYEKIKLDPTQFLRMYGRPLRIHLDPAVSTAAEGPQSMMPWQGDESNMIDRFDVRANLDLIPEYVPEKISIPPSKTEDEDERFANYERYRCLVENEAAGLSEEYSLHQIYMDEHFGVISKGNEEELEKKKKSADKKAAIGFIYEDSTPSEEKKDAVSEDEGEESEEDIEMADLDVTIDVDTLNAEQSREINLCATQYGMKSDDFVRLLRKDKEELEALKEARQLEEAKAQFSGRKSRKERRAINEKRQNPLRFSRPSYAARESPKYEPYKRQGSSSRSRSRSRSRTPVKTVKKFITSFGADSDEEAVVQGPALPPNFSSSKKSPESSKCGPSWSGAIKAVNKSKSKSRSKSRSLSRSRSRSRSRRYRHSSDSSRSYSRSISRSRSRSRSKSRSRSRHRRYSGDRRSRGRRSSSRSRSRSRSSRPKPSAPSFDSAVKKPQIEVKRYRRASLSSNSGLSGLDSDDNEKDTSMGKSPLGSVGRDEGRFSLSLGGKITSKQQSQGSKLNIKERLKRKMQAQLTKQYKADKKARITKITQQEQERLDREEEIRTLALDMRRREREKRHRELEEEERDRIERVKRREADNSDSDSSSSSNSRGLSSERRKTPERKRFRNEASRSDERRREDRKDDRRDERRRGTSSEDRRRSDERRWDGRDRRREEEDRFSSRFDRDSSRWSGDRGSSDRSGRWSSSGTPDNRWDNRADRRWEGRRGEYGDRSSWSNGRSHRGPLLQRPGSPLMSRPRPPNDPRLMEEYN